MFWYNGYKLFNNYFNKDSYYNLITGLMMTYSFE